MTVIPMRREGAKLVPPDELCAEELKNALPNGGDCMVTISFPRSLQQLRMWWALCQKLSEMVDWILDKDQASDLLKLKIGHVRTIVVDEDGSFEILPKSISFASLKQSTFNRIFNRALYVTASQIVPDIDEDALRSEIMEMIT